MKKLTQSKETAYLVKIEYKEASGFKEQEIREPIDGQGRRTRIKRMID